MVLEHLIQLDSRNLSDIQWYRFVTNQMDNNILVDNGTSHLSCPGRDNKIQRYNYYNDQYYISLRPD